MPNAHEPRGTIRGIPPGVLSPLFFRTLIATVPEGGAEGTMYGRKVFQETRREAHPEIAGSNPAPPSRRLSGPPRHGFFLLKFSHS